jgi:hypothetical protein
LIHTMIQVLKGMIIIKIIIVMVRIMVIGLTLVPSIMTLRKRVRKEQAGVTGTF